MKCFQCGNERSLIERTKPKGQSGEFTCRQCLYGDPEPEPKGEQMTTARQLEKWVAGESVHNATRDECCPDFSCCLSEMQWSKERRIEFAGAVVNEDHKKANSMLIGSLARMTAESDTDAKARVAGTGL